MTMVRRIPGGSTDYSPICVNGKPYVLGFTVGSISQ